MAFSRAGGILLHPTSLPGWGGIGTMGRHANAFLETLHDAGIGLWQVLPLGPTGYGDSPYSALSAFAGNPYLIDLDPLLADGWLHEEDVDPLRGLPESHVDFGRLVPAKTAVLQTAFQRFAASSSSRDRLDRFTHDNAAWLEDYTLYMAIKDEHGGAPWNDWDEPLRARRPEALHAARDRLAGGLAFHRFVQYVFFRQWEGVKRRANELGIRIVGDIPIFVAYDSSDVWGNQHLFQLRPDGMPEVVAGVPPDYFSATGQLWGNPHYRWDVMAESGYQWWVDRFRMILRMVDIVRLDHFRGFAGAWAVPHGNATAEQGAWVPGPGESFFSALRDSLGTLPIIAEDLGVITPDVDRLRDAFGFPGMQILQFAFGSDPENGALPHNFPRNTVVYTGTHDNDTTLGWWASIDDAERRVVQRYVNTLGQDISWDLIRLAFASVADMAITPLQDVLRAGTHSRMNLPGRAEGNWSWRFVEGAISEAGIAGLRNLTETYGRTSAGSSVSS